MHDDCRQRDRIAGRIAASVTAALLVAGGIGLTAPGAGAAIGPVQRSPGSGPPGTQVTVSGTGCGPGLPTPAPDYVSVSSTTLPLNAHVSVNGAGAWSTTFTVPPGTPAVPAVIAALCFTDGFPSLTTIYTPSTFLVTAASPPTTPPPPPLPTTPTTPTTKATTSSTKAGSPGGGSGGSGPGTGGVAPGAAGTATRGAGSGRGGAAAANGEDRLAGAAPASKRSGAVAGLRSPELTRDGGGSPGGVSWWWWLVLALLVAAGIGTWLWARGHGTPAEPNGAPPRDPWPHDGLADEDHGVDDWLDVPIVDDQPVGTR